VSNLKGKIKRVLYNDPEVLPIVEEVVKTFKCFRGKEPVQIIMAVAYMTKKVSKSYISRYYKKTHITSVTTAVTKVNNLCDIDKIFKTRIDMIKDMVKHRINSNDMLAKNLEVYQELKNQL
jgi:hypothetical protein